MKRMTTKVKIGGIEFNQSYDPSYGESWTNWLVMPGSTPESEVEDVIKQSGLGHTSIGCPGMVFTSSASIRRTPTRVLITQRAGLDV